jgi:WD40 repeat protein
VRIWDLSTGQPAGELQGDAVKAVRGLAWHPDGKQLAAWGTEKVVRLWDAANGEPLGTLGAFETPLRFGQWLAGGQQWLAVGEDYDRDGPAFPRFLPVVNWDAEGKRALWTRKMPCRPHVSTSVSLDESLIVVVNHGDPTLVLDRRTGDTLLDLGLWAGPQGAFNPTGDRLAARRGLELEVLQTRTGSTDWLGFIFDEKTAMTYTPAGEILNPSEELDKHIAYAVETLDGEIQLLSWPEFRKLVARN